MFDYLITAIFLVLATCFLFSGGIMILIPGFIGFLMLMLISEIYFYIKNKIKDK